MSILVSKEGPFSLVFTLRLVSLSKKCINFISFLEQVVLNISIIFTLLTESKAEDKSIPWNVILLLVFIVGEISPFLTYCKSQTVVVCSGRE